MSATNDGGPAFPVVRMPLDPDTILNRPGMSLRDWFAGQALNQCVAEMWGNEDGAAGVAGAAYEIADAMLRAREVKL